MPDENDEVVTTLQPQRQYHQRQSISSSVDQNPKNQGGKGSVKDHKEQPYDPSLVQRLKWKIAISKRANSHKIASAVDKQKQIRRRIRVINLISDFKSQLKMAGASSSKTDSQ